MVHFENEWDELLANEFEKEYYLKLMLEFQQVRLAIIT